MVSFEMEGIEYRFFNHLFAVSECGKVLRLLTPYKPRSTMKNGYLTLGRSGLMHRIVATCWVENPDNKNVVHHINGDRSDNRASNLMWVSQKEHIADHHHDNVGVYVRTPETLEKYRQAQLGKKSSDETKAKIRASSLGIRKGLPFHFTTPYKYNGIIYPSLNEACKAAGVSRNCFYKRALSKNFPLYEIVPFLA